MISRDQELGARPLAGDIEALVDLQTRRGKLEAGGRGESLLRQLLSHMPADVRAGLSDEQNAALAAAADRCAWEGHEIDLRLSIPLPFKRYYFVLLGGQERRRKKRRVEERGRHPITTLRNLLFLGVFTSVFTMVGALAWMVLFTWYLSS